MKQQKGIVGEYWSDYAKEQERVHAGQHRCSARRGR